MKKPLNEIMALSICLFYMMIWDMRKTDHINQMITLSVMEGFYFIKMVSRISTKNWSRLANGTSFPSP